MPFETETVSVKVASSVNSEKKDKDSETVLTFNSF